MSNNTKHDWLVNKLYTSPSLLDINEEVITKSLEPVLMYKGHYLTVPDINFKTKYNNYYVEVKSSHSSFLYNKGMSQLEKVLDWHNKNNLEEPVLSLFMPLQNEGKYWIDMLDNFVIYKLGDSFNQNI